MVETVIFTMKTTRQATQKTKFTPQQVARMWGISHGKVLAWIHSGQLKAVNVAAKMDGRPQFLVDVSELAEFEARRTTQPAPKIPSRRRKRFDEGQSSITNDCKRTTSMERKKTNDEPAAKPVVKCITCDNPAVYCGLCGSCRTAAQRFIKKGKATREQLEQAGLILPGEGRDRKPSNWTKKAKEVLAIR